MSIFQSNKTNSVSADDLREEAKKAEEKRIRKLKQNGSSRYYTHKRVRDKIDKLLHERNALWSNFEHLLDTYKDPAKKKKAEQENRRILKQIGAINQQVKQADEQFFREIEVDDNL